MNEQENKETKTHMSHFHCFLGNSPSDAHNSSNPLCNLHFKEGPSKVILEAELLDLRQPVEARKTCRTLEFETCLQKKKLFKGCSGQKLSRSLRKRWQIDTNSIKLSQNRVARSHAIGQHSPHQLVQNKVVRTKCFYILSWGTRYSHRRLLEFATLLFHVFPILCLFVDHAMRPDCKWQIQNNKIQQNASHTIAITALCLDPGHDMCLRPRHVQLRRQLRPKWPEVAGKATIWGNICWENLTFCLGSQRQQQKTWKNQETTVRLVMTCMAQFKDSTLKIRWVCVCKSNEIDLSFCIGQFR